MKTIGMIGGMSWESSIEYYRLVNEMTKEKLGGLHSARSLMVSVDFAEIEEMQRQGRWDEASDSMVAAAQALEQGGADFIILCTNTMHKCAREIEAQVHIPFLHIADPTAGRIKAAGLKKVGLLGTRFTMEEDFYKKRLVEVFGLQVVIPAGEERQEIHRVIYEELVLGKILPQSRRRYMQVLDELVRAGAEGVILGCTEIGLLIHEGDCLLPLFDTTRIHAEAAVDYALGVS